MSCISYPNTCPADRDQETTLLGKILQVLNAGGGGGGSGVSGIKINGGPTQTGLVLITTGSGTVTSVNGDPGPAVSLDSGEIPEGANLYYTAARFNTAFAGKTTADLAELTNLYFTTPRVRAADLTGFASALGAITAADTVLSAFGKTQGRLAALEAGTAGPFLLKAGDTGTGAFLFTPSANDVVPLTLTTTAGSLTTSNNLVVNYGAANLLTLRNDGRLSLTGRITAITSDALGHGLRATDTNTAAAAVILTIAHNTTTAGANGIGAIFDWNLHSTTTSDTRASRWTTLWTDATHATRTSTISFTAFTAGTESIQLLLGAGQVQGTDGTASLPAFTSRNDTNTGMYFSAADTLAWAIAGVQEATLSATQFNLPSGGFTGVNTDAANFVGTNSLSGSSASASLRLNPSWNTSGAPSAIEVSLSNTASAATSNFLKFAINLGATLYTVSKAGAVSQAAGLTVATEGIVITSGKFSSAVANLTDAANIATNAALANHFRVTLAGNRTLDNPTNPYDGARVIWEFLQDGTGNRTIAFGAAFSFGSDITGVTLSTAAGARDYMTAIYQATAAKWQVVAFVKGYV